MAKPPKQQHRPPTTRVGAAAVNAALNPQLQGAPPIPVQKQTTHVFQGPVPHPEILERYNVLVPGTAQRMIQLAEDESLHRRKIEDQTTAANITAQAKQFAIADYQSKAVFRSDTIGQVAGVIVSLTCVAGAVYLATSNHEWVAGALAAIPTAAVIQAFFAKRPSTQSKLP